MAPLQGIQDQVLAVLVAGALEGAGVPWPGAVIVAGAGLAVGGDWTDIWRLAVLFAAGYSLGAVVQYALGRLLGPVALRWLPAKFQARLHDMVARHGASVVFWTRPFAIGNYVSIPAGMMKMPLRRFLPATYLGICPWAFGLMWAGGLLGGLLGDVQAAAETYLLHAALVLGIGAVALLVWRWVRLLRVSPEV